MKRSRRRTSRRLIALLTLALVVSAICVVRRATRGSGTAPSNPSLSVLDVATDEATSPQTRPTVVVATIAQEPAPLVETSTPTGITPTAPAIQASATTPGPTAVAPAAAPSTQPAVASAPKGSWSQLLNGGSADGINPAITSTTRPSEIVTGNGPIADGKARLAAGEFLGARSLVNDSLVSGKLSDTDTTAAKSLIAEINQTVVFSPRVIPGDAFTFAYPVKSGDSLAKIANANSTTWELLARINHLDPKKLRYGTSIKVIHGPFFAVVTKQTFTMDVYLGGLPGETGSTYVESFQVGLGKDDSTPTGLWAIGAHAKLRHPTYYPPEGGSPIDADDPKNPLGGYWIALTGVDGQAVGRTSYGIHGTIEPDSIGKQASMGCIRLKNDDIAMVFDLMSEGKSKVLVKP